MDTHYDYLRRVDQVEVTWVAGYISRWFTHWKMVTHPNTNRAQRRVTLTIVTNKL